MIHLKNLDNSYACNFLVLKKNIICDTIPGLENVELINCLQDRNISITDVQSKQNSIDILIGDDVAGKWFTGKKVELENGVIAFQTFLEWKIMGKLPQETPRVDNAILVVSLHVQEADVSELWRLDTISIEDPIEKVNKIIRDKRTLKTLMETVRLTMDGLYEVELPFKENHIEVSSNFSISHRRLLKTVEKLKGKNLFKAYNDNFEEWLLGGIIEEVLETVDTESGHYLPHRPVIKPNSTTEIRPVFDASAHGVGFPSLNQCLERGPNLIELVPSTLNRFREYEIGVVSDIKKHFCR